MSKNTFENSIETINTIDLASVTGGTLLEGAAIGSRGVQSANYKTCMDDKMSQANSAQVQSQQPGGTVVDRFNTFNGGMQALQRGAAQCAGQYPL